ncbi:hypothetical protein Tco_0414531 [Tanacetum coccineum]
MRTKPGVDTLSFDDLYNNLRVFESGVKGSTASSTSKQNVAFVSSESTNSTNDVSTAYGVSTSSGVDWIGHAEDEKRTLLDASHNTVPTLSVEIPDFVPKPTVNEPTIVSKLKVWSDAPVIDEYESNSDDEYVIEPSKE